VGHIKCAVPGLKSLAFKNDVYWAFMIRLKDVLDVMDEMEKVSKSCFLYMAKWVNS